VEAARQSDSLVFDFFVTNALIMLAVLVASIFLIGIILALNAMRIRPGNRGLYGDKPERSRIRKSEESSPQDQERQIIRSTGRSNRSIAVMVVGLAAVSLLIVSAFMPWLTIDLGLGSTLSFNPVDFLNLVDFSTQSAGLALQTIQSALYLNANPPNAVLVRDTVFFLLLTDVFYGFALITAIITFVSKEEYLLVSGIFAIISSLLAVAGIETLKTHVTAEGLKPEYSLLIRPDYGVFLAVIAGFVFLGTYFLTRQVPLVEERVVREALMRCPRCGGETPRDSKFCKECGLRVNL
jgi:hypothetical protein